MSKKKTVQIKKIVELVNKKNQYSTCSEGPRRGWNDLVECILLENNRYEGFGHFNQYDVPNGHNPGVRVDANGNCLAYPERFVDTDDTRRFYYWKD